MMYPNLRAEIARRNTTAAEIVKGVWDESGVTMSVSHFSQKLNGKYSFTLNEAFAIKKFLKAKVSIDTLFQPTLEDE